MNEISKSALESLIAGTVTKILFITANYEKIYDKVVSVVISNDGESTNDGVVLDKILTNSDWCWIGVRISIPPEQWDEMKGMTHGYVTGIQFPELPELDPLLWVYDGDYEDEDHTLVYTALIERVL